MKYSFLIPYYNRPTLEETLQSFVDLYADRDDFEVIVCKAYYSNSPSNKCLMYRTYFPLQYIGCKEHTSSCCVCYNEAAAIAKGKYLIITNPECKHITDVLKGFDEELEKQECYVVAACESISDDDRKPLLWYQHSMHNNRKLHFCSCLSAKQWWKANGFCEKYKDGCAFEDDDWLKRVEQLKIPIITRDDLIVQHIEHERGYLKSEDVVRNKDLYNMIWDEHRRL